MKFSDAIMRSRKMVDTFQKYHVSRIPIVFDAESKIIRCIHNSIKHTKFVVSTIDKNLS